QRTVARRTAEARATVPHIEMSAEAEMTAGLAQREREREGDPERWSLTALFVRRCALALREHPRANAAYRDGRFELYSRINVGVVIATEDTYVIPTVFDADRVALAELEHELERLATEAVAGTLAAPAFTAATFTVWNASAHGIAGASIPVVPPQAAALAAGTHALTLSCDHRILYGARAAAFLQSIAHHLDSGRA